MKVLNKVVKDFHSLYFYGEKGGKRLHRDTTWMGVPIVKCPMDLQIYQELLTATKPDLIIETGVHQGGSTLYIAHICDLLGHGEIVACDISLDLVHDVVRQHDRVRLLQGSSVSIGVLTKIREMAAGRRAMVILDSDHSAKHVRKELRLYAPLVAEDCYLICEDSNINGHPVRPESGPGPFEAIEEFLAEHPEWKSDPYCERLLITYNPRGYLKRTPAKGR